MYRDVYVQIQTKMDPLEELKLVEGWNKVALWVQPYSTLELTRCLDIWEDLMKNMVINTK
jgi:hypothetical protein